MAMFIFIIFFVMCMLLYTIEIAFLCWFQHNPFCNCTRTDWDMIYITQLGLVITFIFLFLACFYIPSEWEFYAETNAINHLSIWVELTELWGFLYLPSAYGNVYFVFFIFYFCYMHVSVHHRNHIFMLIPTQFLFSKSHQNWLKYNTY